MPKKRHPAVFAGIAFAILGGAMIASSFLVSWVDSYDFVTNALLKQLLIWNLTGVSDANGIYYLAFLIPIFGVCCATLASIALVDERRNELRRLAIVGVLVTSVAAAFITTLLIWLLREEYINDQLNRSIYGPAIFLSVFGCVLAVAGGIVLVVDYSHSQRKKGTFVTAAGSKHLGIALKPIKRGHPNQEKESQDKELQEEMRAAEGANDLTEGEEGLSCPNCRSPVKASWRLCPVCGEELE
jgi:hypothetical protein